MEMEDKILIRKKRVLVVGAGGFTGGFIVEEGLRRGYEVWAGVRENLAPMAFRRKNQIPES